MKYRTSNHGFTMIELLVAMAMTSVVATGVYSVFFSQQKSYMTQDQVAFMQQNLRGGMDLMEREIRMAGFDPTGTAKAGIVTAQANSIRITKDTTDNAGTGDPDGDVGDVNEDITYSLLDVDGDGVNDLVRNDAKNPGNQMVAQDIDALNLVYLDKDGNPTATLSDIRSVQIALLARSHRKERGYTNTTIYKNERGDTIFTPPPGDHYRRSILRTEVKCRNLGLD
jgi:type IV pilus assembly protein PilW